MHLKLGDMDPPRPSDSYAIYEYIWINVLYIYVCGIEGDLGSLVHVLLYFSIASIGASFFPFPPLAKYLTVKHDELFYC